MKSIIKLEKILFVQKLDCGSTEKIRRQTISDYFIPLKETMGQGLVPKSSPGSASDSINDLEKTLWDSILHL